MGSTLGTLERITSADKGDLSDIVKDEKRDIELRGAAAVAYAGQTLLGWSAYGLKTAADAIVGAAVSGLEKIADIDQ